MDPKIIELMPIVKIPLELNCKSGDHLLIVTDFEFEPVVWQAMSAAATQMGLETTVVMMPVREAHQAEPTRSVAEAMKATDVCMYLTSKAMVHTQAAKESYDGKKVRTIIMEQADYSILTSPICKADYSKIQEEGQKIQEAFNKAKEMTVLTELGTPTSSYGRGSSGL